MLEVRFSSEFKKQTKLMKKRGEDINLLKEMVVRLQNEEKLEPRYRDHLLHGIKPPLRELHIKPDWLLLYRIDHRKNLLELVNTGSHSDVFK